MNARTLLCVCGAAATLLSTTGLAQTTSNPSPARPSTERQPSDTRPNMPRPATDAHATTGSAQPAVLSRLEGLWKVEVTMHEGWKGSDGMRDDKLGDRPSEPMTPPDADGSKTTRPEDRKPDSSTLPAGTKSAHSKNFTGYAERKLVLGNNFLHECIVLPEMSGAMKHDHDKPGARPDSTDRTSEDGFRGMSFIAFDAPAQTYRIVFMDSRHNDIHVDSGRYEAQTNTIVFHGKAGSETSPDASSPGTQPGYVSDPADFSRKPAGEDVNKLNDRSRFGHGNVRVVVEVLSDDQHQVTMYRLASGQDSARPAGNQADRPADRQPGETTKPKDARMVASTSESIVYRAVYTRATGAEANRFQRLIDEDRSLTRANTTDR